MPHMLYVTCSNAPRSPLLILFVFFFLLLSFLLLHCDSCNSCSTKCSSSKWLWEQRLLRGECHSNIPPANQEVRGRGACHSRSPNRERLNCAMDPPLSPTRTWTIHTVLFVCLTVETAGKKVLSVSFSSWQICMERLSKVFGEPKLSLP